MSFWDNVTGSATDAYSKPFVDVIPNGTQALAVIKEVKLAQSMGNDCIQIDWQLCSGQFDGQYIFQKLHIFDQKPEKALKARNMLMLIMNMFHVKQLDDNPPTVQFLQQLKDKTAGLKIAEWQMPKQDGSMGHGNNVAEVHPAASFVTETGKYREFKEQAPKGVDSALTRHANMEFSKELNDDVPF